MSAFSTSITVGNQPVWLNVPKGTEAWHKANSIFCPLGPAPTQGWFLMLKGNLAELDKNAAHTVVWTQTETDDVLDAPTLTTRTLSFPGLYIVNAERLTLGGVGDANALYLVELADARLLMANKSDTGSIIANIRSYANSTDFLTETTTLYGTWANLVSGLWSACGLLGSFPGLPGPLPIDGAPNNTWLVGLNAWRALTAVLDQLDCAIKRDPLSNTFTIVQLGETQDILPAGYNDTLRFNSEPYSGVVTQAAANLNIYFVFHRKSYGQERDTELSQNWAYNGEGNISNIATGITGAQGTAPLWDDLPWILDENNTQTNSADISSRVTNRKLRYVTRQSVTSHHRIHRGLRTEYVPGGQIRAVLWRNWGDGDSNKVGGTVTEFVCSTNLVTGFKSNSGGTAWLDAQLTAPEREQYGPPDLGRRTYPNYPRLPNIVQVWHSGGVTVGTTVNPSSGFHRGRVKRWVSNAMTTLDDCWIIFVDDYDNVTGQVSAVQGEYYGPARLSGVSTFGGTTLPVYLVSKGDSGKSDVVFELTSVLELSEQATAVICSIIAGEYVAGSEAITVKDFYNSPGEWQGEIGYRGLGRKRTDNTYDIVWMERPALFSRSSLTANFVTPSSGVTVNSLTSSYFQQGEKIQPGTAQVFDPQEMYPLALSGGKTLAVWNSIERRREAVVTQQQGIYATAKLQSILTGETVDIQFTDFQLQTFSPFNLTPAAITAAVGRGTALNWLHCHGEASDTILLLWLNDEQKWLIIHVDEDQRWLELVTLDASNGSGNLQEGGILNNLFRGKTITPYFEALGGITVSRPCIIHFTDFTIDMGLSDDPIVAELNRTYGPAKWVGVSTAALGFSGNDINKPIYRCSIGEQEFHGKKTSDLAKGVAGLFQLYDYSDPPAPTGIYWSASPLYNKYKANKFARLNRQYGGTIANQVEC